MRMVIFNILIVFFLLIAVLFPLLFLEQEITAGFLRVMWPFGLVVISALGILNTFFLLNRKLFSLLEQEDWPALAAYLEKKVYQEGRYSSRYVRLLSQSFLASGNFDGMVNLKNSLAAVKPALVDNNALTFGAAYLLGGNAAGAAEFFRERLEKGQPELADWLRWYYGFSLTLAGSYELAGAAYMELAADAKDVLVAGLSAFSLSELTKKSPEAHAEWRIRAEEGKIDVRKALKTAGKWNRKTEKLKTQVHGAVIRNYLDQTGAWILGGN